MSLTCTRCEGSGFLNLHQIDPAYTIRDNSDVLRWIATHAEHDVSVCDCCGDGEEWYGIAREHYNSDDPIGYDGPYAYNGGLCECH